MLPNSTLSSPWKRSVVTTVMQAQKIPAGPDPGFTCWDGASESSLAHALSPPVTECMEAALIDGNQYNQLSFRARSDGCLRLAVTTRSAYRHQVVRAFVGAMAVRVELSRDLRERIHTAVQEAMINSVLHGNLAIGSELCDSLEGLTTSHQVIERLLMSPQIARSMIRVEAIWSSSMLYILVRDSGAGFKRGELPSSDEWKADHHGSGRGLAILDAFCDRIALLNGGATIKMGFRLPGDRP
jgi:anti-sigma regulatory factor (Ser/Thr protein kinase)